MVKRYTPTSAAADVEAALRVLEGRVEARYSLPSLRWQGHAFFPTLSAQFPALRKRCWGQQLKSMEADGIVHRTAYPQVPPKVEYRLTKRASLSVRLWMQSSNGQTGVRTDERGQSE